MEFTEVLRNRHSVRSFADKAVERDLLVRIVQNAQAAPSWVNAQEWKVYIALGETLKKIKAEFKERAAQGVKGDSDFPVVHRTEWSQAAQKNMAQLLQSVQSHFGLEEFGRAQDNLFDAPALVYLTLPKGAVQWAILDLGAFEQTLLLSATNYGLGSIPAYAIIKYPDVIRKHMGISDDETIAIGIALGYPADKKINEHRSKRVPVKEILTIRD